MDLKQQLALKLAEARKAYEAGDVTTGDKLKTEAETLKAALDGMKALDGLATAATPEPMRPGLPGMGDGSMPGANGKSADPPQPAPADNPAVKAIYTMRFGDEDAAHQAIMTDLVGKDYRQILWDQQKAFGRYIRHGNDALEKADRDLLRLQIFPIEDIKTMVKHGYALSEIKTTMVEAQGTLGGFAVPTTMQSEVIRRLPGMTVVRGGGATVINLTTGNATEILEVTGADANHRYTGNLRGQWGSETQAPTEQHLTFGLRTLNADIYTYKVVLSQSLVEDASNVVDILQEEVVTTLAIDEDDAFLIGDGVGKPLGILPGSANALAITEVNSGSATAMTASGLKRLKRAIPVQYRGPGRFIANSDTYGDIEVLLDGMGRYLFEDLTETDRLLGKTAAESEAMPDVAANAFAMLYGNLAGYYILERSGLTIMRFQDSNTGINKVEYQIRRRVGGRLVKPWMLAVQKIAA